MYNAYNEKVKEIKVALLKLEEALHHRPEDYFISDGNSPNLYLWKIYTEYLCEITAILHGEALKKYSMLDKNLNLESLKIDAKSDYEESKLQLENYIKQVKAKLYLED